MAGGELRLGSLEKINTGSTNTQLDNLKQQQTTSTNKRKQQQTNENTRNYEMSQVNFVVRQLVRLLYGASLPTGSVERAADAFAAAIKLAPSRLAHRVELGRALSKLGRCDEARKELEAALAMDVTDVNDALERAEAQVLLARLPRRGGLAVAPLLLGGGNERDSSSNGSANGGASSA
jgi:predicted Zn-dependent protease